MDVLNVVLLIDVCFCLPLTILLICCVFCEIRRDQIPVYFINLLISNLIQLFTMIVWVVEKDESRISEPSIIIFCCSVMASLAFRMCIALERYFVIAFPLLRCIRQIKSSVLFCVTVWAGCIITFPLPMHFDEHYFLSTLAILPAFIFIFCLAGTARSLLKTPSAASSVPAEEKRRIVGTLVLLLLNYAVTILPTLIWKISEQFMDFYHSYNNNTVLTMLLFSPFVDLILFVFMFKGLFDKLLRCLRCCKIEDNAADEGSRTSV